MTILSNPGGGGSTRLHLAANAVLVVAGNNTVSNLTSNSSEVVTGATVGHIVYGSQTPGCWLVMRGNSTVNTIVGAYTGSGESTTVLNILPTQNLVFQLVGTANGFIVADVRKDSAFV